MMNQEDLLQKMKNHFPRWMDIRKRTDKSVGGKLLSSVAEEFSDSIQIAIDDYKKDFFIDNYQGREDDIVAFLYKSHIGSIDVEKLKFTKPVLDITTSLKEFYDEANKIYYEDGNIFVKTNEIDSDVLEYSIEDFPTTAYLEKIHVWNVFDEFAAFMGLKRYEWETNSELTNRILNIGRRKPDSTTTGLKNAILNALTNIAPNLKKESIKIEPPTPENLLKYYKEFGSVIEKMAQVNRDIYRTKRWDVDRWQRNFKSVDYMPHAWDILIDSYQSGVGFEDDLKVIMTNADDKTDAIIKLYKESEETVQEFIKQANIKKKIDIGLKKYNDVINPINVQYKITASEAEDITAENISVTMSQITKGEEERYIESIINKIDATRDVEIIDHSKIDDNKKYNLIFEPKTKFGYMSIEKCNINDQSILKAINGFMFNEAGILQSSNTKSYITRVHQFSKTQNAVNSKDGMTIDRIDQEAVLTLPLNGVQNQSLYMNYYCNKTAIPKSSIVFEGCDYASNGEIHSSENMGDAIEFTIEANEISFSVNGGCIITTTIDGVANPLVTIFNKDAYEVYSTPKSLSPKKITMRIQNSSDGFIMKIKDLVYNNFSITKQLTDPNAKLFEYEDRTLLPSINTDLIITMSTKTAFVPVIEFIHIGTPLTNAKYEIILPDTIDRKIDVLTNCKMTLQELDQNGAVINTINNYEPYKEYRALSDQSYIKLDMTSYSMINEMRTYIGKFETIGSGNSMDYYLRLNKGNTVSKIIIDGERLVSKTTKLLYQLLNITAKDSIIANKLLKSFVVLKEDGSQEIKKIGSSTISNFGGEHIKISGLPDNLECAFLLSEATNTVAVANSYFGEFISFYIYPKSSNTYIAFNESKLIKKEINNIEMVNVFNPFLPLNKKMVYTVESLDNKNTVKFETKEDAIEFLPNWCLESKTLRIATNIDLNNQTSYQIDTKNIEKEYPLRSIIPLDISYVLPNGEIINLAEFEVETKEGINVFYKSKAYVSEEERLSFEYAESFIPEDDGFNKLKYATIDNIDYIGTTPYNEDVNLMTPLPEEDYSILTEDGIKKGIIIWNNPIYSNNSQTIYVKYSFKKPDYLKIDTSELYKAVEYSIDAYKEILSIDLSNQEDNSTYDLNQHEENLIADRISVFCTKPGFEAELNEGQIVFKKLSKEDAIALKTGYYYVDGDEYYMFSNKSADEIDKFGAVQLFRVDRIDGEMRLYKESNNFIKNSMMTLDNLSEIYNVNFLDKKISGISHLNSITACNSFNHWITFGANLYLVKGYNGLGLQLEPTVDNGYAYLDITNNLLPTTNLSFFMTKGMEAYIGKEKKVFGLELNKATTIGLEYKINESKLEENIYQCEFIPEPNYKYYLIIKNKGSIDDIILQDGSEKSLLQKDLHKKNISHLNLEVEEKIMNDYTCRVYLNDNRGAECNGAELNKENVIVGSSLIDWGITRIKKFDDNQSWSGCTLNKVDIQDGVIKSLFRNPGSIETEPIYIGDVRTIKNLIFKINDVMFDNMKGFSTKILISDKYNGNYRMVSSNKDNIGYVNGSYLLPYIKLLVDIPGDKIIDNIEIFAEYMSNENAAPAEIAVPNGVFVSRIFDARYPSKYKLKSIAVDSVSNIKDIAIQIRGAKEGYDGEVWTTWKDVILNDNLSLVDNIIFNNYRFFQVKITLKNKNAYVKLKHLDLGVIQ